MYKICTNEKATMKIIHNRLIVCDLDRIQTYNLLIRSPKNILLVTFSYFQLLAEMLAAIGLYRIICFLCFRTYMDVFEKHVSNYVSNAKMFLA
jgi:hypothetical protein